MRDEKELLETARKVREDILDISYTSSAGHIPSALSMVDYLTVLFSNHIDFDTDKLVIGKPYGSQAYYSLFKRLGLIKGDIVRDFGRSEKNLSYGITHEHPLISFADDTLGNALSVACGIAMASRHKRVYVNLSDAVMQAGTIWEAVMLAKSYLIGNLFLLIDNNNLQCLGNTSSIVSIEPICARLESFGWNVCRISEGNKIRSISYNLSKVLKKQPSNKPTAIIFDTVKGSGVSFMEDKREWHYRTLTKEEYLDAKKEVGGVL